MPSSLPPDAYKDIVPAVARGDAQYVVDALHALPSGAKPRALVRMGFHNGVDGGSVRSFAVTCMVLDQPDVLDYFLEHNGLGITLTDCCTKKVYGGLNEGEVYQSLALSAVLNNRPRSLELALRLEPEHPDLVAMHRDSMVDATLFYIALSRAMFGTAGSMECAQLLHRRGAPLACSLFDTTPAASCLLEKRWPSKNAGALREILLDLHAAGAIDLAVPVQTPKGSLLHGKLPLDHAIRTDNCLAARELVLLGSDTTSFLIRGCSDLLEHVLRCELEHEDEMLAYLREALMQARLAGTRADEAAAQTTQSPRCRRAAI